MLVYVDDLIITGNNGITCQQFNTYLQNWVKVKDLEALDFFLGLQISCITEGIHLNQNKYAQDIV